MYSIETKSLTKKYKDKTVVSNLNLKIKEGELFSLLGTNGAGKTTTIKMLSSLIVPTEGDIIIDKFDMKKNKQVMPQQDSGQKLLLYLRLILYQT